MKKNIRLIVFQLLLKGCTIEARNQTTGDETTWFQLLLKGCTIEANMMGVNPFIASGFQLLLKGCTIEAPKPTD